MIRVVFLMILIPYSSLGQDGFDCQVKKNDGEQLEVEASRILFRSILSGKEVHVEFENGEELNLIFDEHGGELIEKEDWMRGINICTIKTDIGHFKCELDFHYKVIIITSFQNQLIVTHRNELIDY
ncbi:MAG: hypothetical protein GC193_10485 [Cryomorphaceae bacterium]|nr:hypothetical protein [Cryomorphaceae bacterium]